MLDRFLDSRGTTAAILALILLLSNIPGEYAQVPTGADLKIIRLEDRHTPPTRGALLVQLQDVSSGPVAGAEVTFTVPKDIGNFASGENQVTVLTNPQGIATAEGLQLVRPNTPADIVVSARYGTISVSRTLRYNETRPAAKRWKWVALAGVAGAVAIVAVLVTRTRSSGGTAGTISVTAGPPTLSHP